MVFGDIPLGPFSSLPDPLIPLDDNNWERPTNAEFYGYSTGNALTGGKSFSDSFVLHSTYEQPGEGNNKEYLIRRSVWVSYTGTPQPFNAEIALSRYYNASLTDHWTTTALATTGYNFEKQLGWLLTKNGPDRSELDECYIPGWNDHMIVLNDHSTNTPCGQGNTRLRTLGWVFSKPQPNTKLIYRCYDSVQFDHYVSDDSRCERNINPDYPLGYILTQ